ncbi:MAG: TetR/AcrR family transcriptional regulator [Clostridia bacterium]|nr:TetR/AcrR family transcriptional regulator [Lachnospiraceae bacterium]NCB99226.1 TetR/AcrR family transcriptional regulator [Clostridia bacterium]NCD01376.1 TetR/AcrR family transcriptional regulator [Clostridia bacterium]
MLTSDYKQENIDCVMDAAFKLCKEIGITAVNKTNLSKASGLSPKSIQRYFDGKVDMIYKISKKMLERNYEEIMSNYRACQPEKYCCTERLQLFLQSHNNYVLNRYKDMIFIQNADLFCRFGEEKSDKYRHLFCQTSALEKGIGYILNIGFKDGSINADLDIEKESHLIAILCAGLVERLSNDIDIDEITIEEAVKVSNDWIERTAAYLQR